MVRLSSDQRLYKLPPKQGVEYEKKIPGTSSTRTRVKSICSNAGAQYVNGTSCSAHDSTLLHHGEFY